MITHGIRHIMAHCVNTGLHDSLYHLGYHGLEEPSRNGNVIVSPTPVITTYPDPRRRVLVSDTRDANPFFHIFETMWMLAGRNDLGFLTQFLPSYENFSDDGETVHGAYGYRWRHAFGYDQIQVIVDELRVNPQSRRCVLQMWDPTGRIYADEADQLSFRWGADDLHLAMSGGKDVPCNTAIYFDTLGGKLNMAVTCRSNDVIWGAYGANVVHFSFLLEYMAALVGLPMGVYRQFSNNFHVYEDKLPKAKFYRYADDVLASSIYSSPGVMKNRNYDANLHYVPILSGALHLDRFNEDLEVFMSLDANFYNPEMQTHYTTPFFSGVVGPMYEAWLAWKHRDFVAADQHARTIVADDWRIAAISWLGKRAANRKENENV